jgi:hypothetical protein
MFEIGLLSIIVLAVGYWVTLWLMGRHDDVLHGDFVHAEPGAKAGPVFPAPSFPVKPKVMRPLTRPAAIKPVAAKPFPTKPAVTKPAVRSAPTEMSPAPQPASPTPTLTDRSDTLQALLASIKRDLRDASQL